MNRIANRLCSALSSLRSGLRVAILWFAAVAIVIAPGCSPAQGPSSGDGESDASGSRAATQGVLEAWQAAVQAEGRQDPKYHLALRGSSLGGSNLAQGFDVTVDGAGFSLNHKQRGWAVRFATRGVRCGGKVLEVSSGQARGVPGEPHTAAIGRRANGTGFEEWLVNGPLGLELGFPAVWSDEPAAPPLPPDSPEAAKAPGAPPGRVRAVQGSAPFVPQAAGHLAASWAVRRILSIL